MTLVSDKIIVRIYNNFCDIDMESNKFSDTKEKIDEFMDYIELKDMSPVDMDVVIDKMEAIEATFQTESKIGEEYLDMFETISRNKNLLTLAVQSLQ